MRRHDKFFIGNLKICTQCQSNRVNTLFQNYWTNDLGHFWLGYIRMLGHLEMSTHILACCEIEAQLHKQ